MTIKWEAPINTTGVVRYGLNGATDRESRQELPHPLIAESSAFVTNLTETGETRVTRTTTTSSVYLYEVTLLNLRPNSVYTYSAQMGATRTQPKQFKTFAMMQNDPLLQGQGRHRGALPAALPPGGYSSAHRIHGVWSPERTSRG